MQKHESPTVGAVRDSGGSVLDRYPQNRHTLTARPAIPRGPGTFTDDRGDLLDAVDLAAVWPELVGPQGRNRQWPCPNPNHAQTGATPPVTITDGRLWYCHGCESGGTILDLFMVRDGCDTADAFDRVRTLTGRERPHPRRRDRLADLIAPQTRPGRRQAAPERPAAPTTRKAPAEAPRATVDDLDPTAGRITGPEAEQTMAEYLDRRQWPPQVADAFDLYPIRGAGGTVRIRHPYRRAGQIVWWQDRATWDAQVKWLPPQGHRRYLYATDTAQALTAARGVPWERPVLFVVEGPADTIALWCAAPDAPVVGIPGTGGLDRWGSVFAATDVIVCTDADDAGDRCAEHLARLVTENGGRAARARPPAGMDVDEWRRHVGNEHLPEAIIAALEPQEWTTR